jgi:hypothetical protein
MERLFGRGCTDNDAILKISSTDSTRDGIRALPPHSHATRMTVTPFPTWKKCFGARRARRLQAAEGGAAMSDNVIDLKPPREPALNEAELNFRLYDLAHMATIAEAQLTRTLVDHRPDETPELAVFAVRKLRGMVHELREWFEQQP